MRDQREALITCDVVRDCWDHSSCDWWLLPSPGLHLAKILLFISLMPTILQQLTFMIYSTRWVPQWSCFVSLLILQPLNNFLLFDIFPTVYIHIFHRSLHIIIFLHLKPYNCVYVLPRNKFHFTRKMLQQILRVFTWKFKTPLEQMFYLYTINLT